MTDKRKSTPRSNAGNPFIVGLVISIVFCMLYLKLGYSPPAWLQPVATSQKFLTDVVTSAFVDKQDLREVQRKVALDIAWNPQKFIALDDQLENFF
ncbi:hypothetical protein ACFL2V_04045 [Pseudomonadota bacterium]